MPLRALRLLLLVFFVASTVVVGEEARAETTSVSAPVSVEPPPLDHPLYRAKNCLITPHYAWATKAARQRLMDVSVQNLKAFLDGKPQNVVS